MNMQKRLMPWSLDVWSLGVIILEVVVGFPVWMSYKGRKVRGQQTSNYLMTGAFGVQGRLPGKISKLQREIVAKLPQYLQKCTLCLRARNKDDVFIDFLSNMLCNQPK